MEQVDLLRSLCARGYSGLFLGIGLLALALAQGLPLVAAGSQEFGRLRVPLSADALPLTPEADPLDVHLVLRPEGWRVSQIRPAALRQHGESRTAWQAPRLPGTLLRNTGLQIPHLDFLLSDIDADNDLDVIVVNRYSGAAQSVWVNHGTGPFERRGADRFKGIRFPDDRLSRTDTSRAHLPVWVSLLSSLLPWPAASSAFGGESRRCAAVPESPLVCTNSRPFSGRAPPSTAVLP